MKIINSIVVVKRGGKNRQSNIEALRLLSMLMVLNLHSFSGYEHGTGIAQVLDFFRQSTSICAVNVFLIISGYFGIKWKFKSFFNLLFQVAFYSFGVYIVASLFGFIDFSINGLLSNAKCFYDSWGFVTGYILLYMCSPLLNAFIEKNDNKTIFLTIVALSLSELFITRSFGYLNYGLLYVIGRFLNKSEAVTRYNISAGRSYWIITSIITFIAIVLYRLNICTTSDAMNTFPLGYNYASPFIILQAVFLFLAFARMDFQSKIVNWCSASSFAIFLIHMHPAIKQIGYYGYTESLYNLPVIEHVWKLALLILFVFFGSILIDKIRIFISNSVYKLLHIIRRSLPDVLFQTDTYIPKSIKNIL